MVWDPWGGSPPEPVGSDYNSSATTDWYYDAEGHFVPNFNPPGWAYDAEGHFVPGNPPGAQYNPGTGQFTYDNGTPTTGAGPNTPDPSVPAAPPPPSPPPPPPPETGGTGDTGGTGGTPTIFPNAPELPTFEDPGSPPGLPPLSDIPQMPTEGNGAGRRARVRVTDGITARRGRQASFLTTQGPLTGLDTAPTPAAPKPLMNLTGRPGNHGRGLGASNGSRNARVNSRVFG